MRGRVSYIAGEKYRWSKKHIRLVRSRRLLPSWFRDDPLTATLAYLAVIAELALGSLVIYAVATR